MYDELYAAGLTEIVGVVPQYAAGGVPNYAAGLTEIVGAIPQFSAGQVQAAQAAQQHAQLARQHAAAAQAAGAAAGLPSAPSTVAYGSNIGQVDYSGTRPRLYPLGFNTNGVLANGTSTTTSRPQIPFRPQRLVLPSIVAGQNIAQNFVLSEIRVGKDSQLAQSTQLPGIIFVETAVGIMMTLDTGQPANDIALASINKDGANPHDFWAVMFGAAIDK
jgi:hypothetical protein